MIVLDPLGFEGAVDAVLECIGTAESTSGLRLKLAQDRSVISRGLLALIGQQAPCDYMIGVGLKNTHFVHHQPDAEWVVFPPYQSKSEEAAS